MEWIFAVIVALISILGGLGLWFAWRDYDFKNFWKSLKADKSNGAPQQGRNNQISQEDVYRTYRSYRAKGSSTVSANPYTIKITASRYKARVVQKNSPVLRRRPGDKTYK